MFVIDKDNTIHLTRGDVANIETDIIDEDINAYYTFQPGDVVRLNVFEKKNHSNIVLQKDVEVSKEGVAVEIALDSSDTTIGDVIDKPVDYWYEVVLNPDTAPKTVIGYDEDGPKVFKLYPEGGEKNEH